MMATIRDVAREAGVATSTVSAVMNGSAPVSEAVEVRVRAAIAQTGYVPHGGAQSLRRGYARLVGVILPDIANPHFAAIARVIEERCVAANCMSVVFSTAQDPARERRALEMLQAQRIMGLIIIPSFSGPEHGRLLRRQINVPTVLLDMAVDGLDCDVVRLDNRAAGRLAARELIERGHRRIALVYGIQGLATNDERVRGFEEALKAAGIGRDDAPRIEGRFEHDLTLERLRPLLSRPDRPTALVTISNMMTLAAMRAAADQPLAIPGDLSLVGIDDLECAELLRCPPTVVVVPVRTMAANAIDGLLTRVDEGDVGASRISVHSPTLVRRSSVKAI